MLEARPCGAYARTAGMVSSTRCIYENSSDCNTIGIIPEPVVGSAEDTARELRALRESIRAVVERLREGEGRVERIEEVFNEIYSL